MSLREERRGKIQLSLINSVLKRLRKEFPTHSFDAVRSVRPSTKFVPSEIVQDAGKEYCKLIVDGQSTNVVYDDWLLVDVLMQTPMSIIEAQTEVEEIFVEAFKQCLSS